MGFGSALRSASLSCLFATFAASSTPAQTQQVSETPISNPSQDAHGLTVLRGAIRALGGETVIGSVKDTAITANCVKTSHGKTETHELRWLTRGDYFRVDHKEGDENSAINGARGRTVVLKGKEVPVEERSARAFKSFHLPGMLLLQSLKKDRMKVELLEDESVEDKPTFHVRITDIAATLNSFEPVAEEWWIDKSSFLPIKNKLPSSRTQQLASLYDCNNLLFKLFSR